MNYPLEYTANIRVNYYDTDRMGVVWHGNYLKYFEDAREEMLRELGCPYEQIEQDGVIMPVFETSLRYLHPARYGDVLSVKVFVKEPPRAKIRIDGEISLPNGNLCATGSVTLAFVDAKTLTPCRPPACLRATANRT